ncbi:MAG: hypothetical protein R3F59_13700 [Myxococcota bacterium]
MRRVPLLLLLAACAPSAEITSIASWFGQCAGACRVELAVHPDPVVRIRDPGDRVLLEAPGRWTPAGEAERDQVEADLADTPLQDVYGCPDCADGGGMELALSDGAVTRWEYARPPDELAGADALFHDAADALQTCVASDLVAPDDACAPVTVTSPP